MSEDFEKCTKTKKTKKGYSVECVKGLWCVSASTLQEANSEAAHYFTQYYHDGEYNELLN